jgi:hypothetical protein
MDGSHAQTLQRALEALGNEESLAVALDVSLEQLRAYLAGQQPLPQRVFLEALDIVARGKALTRESKR